MPLALVSGRGEGGVVRGREGEGRGGEGREGAGRGEKRGGMVILSLTAVLGGVWTTESAHSLSRQSSSDHTSSLFPINNPALVYGRWEDDIIWDTEAVPQIPKPIVPQLDPNDPHIILGIPEEPVISSSSEKDGKKVSVLTLCNTAHVIKILKPAVSPHFSPLGWPAQNKALPHQGGRQEQL